MQNAIYLAGKAEWPVGPEDWEAAAESALDAGAFGYIAGGAGGESTMRANLEAFERRRLRPRMLTGNVVRELGVEVLGTRSPAPFLLAPVGVLSIAHADAEVGAARGAAATGVPFVVSSAATNTIEAVAEAMGEAPRWFPALLDQRPRGRGELRPPSRGGGLLRARRHARHAHPRLAAARPAQCVPPVRPRRGVRPVLLRTGLLREARQAT